MVKIISRFTSQSRFRTFLRHSAPSARLRSLPRKHSTSAWYQRTLTSLSPRIPDSKDKSQKQAQHAVMAPTTRSQTSAPSKSLKSPVTSSKSTTSLNSQQDQRSNKPVLAILGTGWAGFTLLQQLSTSSLLKIHDIIVLSPSRTMALTPLLASAACGIFDFRVAEEPVRRISMMNAATHHGSDGIKKYQVWVDAVDFDARVLKCRPAVGSNGNETEKGFVHARTNSKSKDPKGDKIGTFDVYFDQLVIAPGSEVNTFNTPGVEQHCHFMKSVSDAMSVREKILDCFELASLPHYSTSQKRELLHFIIIGGGPTGVELAAELDELIHGHLLSIYPECRDLVSVSVYDVADRMLGMFGEKLSEYAMEKFRRRNVNVCMGRHIEWFKEGKMSVKEDGEVGFGVAVWAAGNKTCGLVEEMERVRKDKGRKVVTDGFLRVLREDGEGVLDGVYALGDAASIDENELPATAEVAVQKARWLAEHLIAGSDKDEKQQAMPRGKRFEYQQKALVAYIGRKDGIVDGGGEWTGKSAWLAWRGGNLLWTQSWRRKCMIMIYWVLNKWDGREIARW